MPNRYWTDHSEIKIHADGPRPATGYAPSTPPMAPYKTASWGLKGAPTQPPRSRMGAKEIGIYATWEGLSKGGPHKAKGPAKVEKVMHEFKTGALHSGSKHGPTVTSRKQAIAIAMSEAGMSKGKKKK